MPTRSTRSTRRWTRSFAASVAMGASALGGAVVAAPALAEPTPSPRPSARATAPDAASLVTVHAPTKGARTRLVDLGFDTTSRMRAGGGIGGEPSGPLAPSVLS